MAESPDNSIITTPTVIIDDADTAWTLVPDLNGGSIVARNGIIDLRTGNVAALHYNDGTISYEDLGGSSYRWDGSDWLPADAPPNPGPEESPDGTEVTSVGPEIVSFAGERWSLSDTGAMPLQVAVNGVPDAGTGLVVKLLYSPKGEKLLYQTNSNGGWWFKSRSSDEWTETTDPTSSTPPEPAGDVPPAAASAGFNRLVYEDTFADMSGIAPNQNDASGYRWYWAQRNGQPANPHNECECGPEGLLIKTGMFPNANIISLPGWAMNNSGGRAKLPPLGTGHWSHCYMECEIQFEVNQNQNVPYQQTGWPAWWAWQADSIGNYGFPGSGLTQPPSLELDMLEHFGNAQWTGGTSGPPNEWHCGVIIHAGGGGGNLCDVRIDSNWHTYGLLWTPGRMVAYLDNVERGSMALQGDAAGIDRSSLFITLGTGPSWPMRVRAMRIWQA